MTKLARPFIIAISDHAFDATAASIAGHLKAIISGMGKPPALVKSLEDFSSKGNQPRLALSGGVRSSTRLALGAIVEYLDSYARTLNNASNTKNSNNVVIIPLGFQYILDILKPAFQDSQYLAIPFVTGLIKTGMGTMVPDIILFKGDLDIPPALQRTPVGPAAIPTYLSGDMSYLCGRVEEALKSFENLMNTPTTTSSIRSLAADMDAGVRSRYSDG